MYKRITIITETIKGITNVELQVFDRSNNPDIVNIECENGRITSKNASTEQIEHCNSIIKKLKK